MNSFISNSNSFIKQKTEELLQTSNVDVHPDYFLIKAPEDKSSIGIKEIKTLISRAYIKPFQGPNKAFVIWEAHMLTEEAQNAFLKILEEPPLDTYFLLFTKNISELLITIRSRCQVVFNDDAVELDANLPSLESILKTRHNERFNIAEEMFGKKTLAPKQLAEKFIDQIIYESRLLNDYTKVVTFSLEAKKHLLSNASPKNALELLFLKLPLWQDLESL